MRIQQIIDGIKGSVAPHLSVAAIIELAAAARAARTAVQTDVTSRLATLGVMPLLETAARLLIEIPIEERFAQIEDLFDGLDAKDLTDFWVRKEAAAQLVGLLGKAETARFHYPLSIRACLTHANAKRQSGKAAHVVYLAQGHDRALVQNLAAVLELNIKLAERNRWDVEEKTVYDCELIMPPLRVNLDGANSVSPAEWQSFGFAKNQGGRASYETLSLLNALSRIRGRVLLAASETLLSRAVGLELVARQKLLSSYRLQAVFGLPAAMMLQGSPARCGLLVLSSQIGTHEKVRMVDLGHPDLAVRAGRGKFPARESADWRDLVNAPVPGGYARDVFSDTLSSNNAVLWPVRFMASAFNARSHLVRQSDDVRVLEEMADLVRPRSLTPSAVGEFTVFEVGPSNLQNGRIAGAQRQLCLTATELRRSMAQVLLPGDILLSIKGIIGAVGLVRKAELPNDFQTVWTASPSIMILRSKVGDQKAPLILHEYLCSEVGRKALSAMAIGATVKTVTASDLKGFPIPIPTDEQYDELITGIHRREAIEAEIARLQDELEAVKGTTWPASLLHSVSQDE